MISPQLEVPQARPSAPSPEEDEELDEALRESFPASDPPAVVVHHHHHHEAPPPAPQPPPPAQQERVSQVVEQVTLGWSPTTAPATWNTPLGEAPHAAETPLPDEPELLTWRYSEEDYDLIDETVAESFPASDPPSWTLGREHTH